MHDSRRTWRIRGVPRDFDKHRLARVLRHQSNLQWPNEGVPEAAGDGGDGGDDVKVHTLAPGFQVDEQVATVRFHNLPLQLCTLGASRQLRIEITITPEDRPVGHAREPETAWNFELSIDEHFDGITTLISPVNEVEHRIDVLAVSGLGSHPFGSFVHKDDGNMWLTNNLPRDIPTARVMIYGYESGLQHSTSLVQLDDLADPLQDVVNQLLRSDQRKPLLLIGHSLGGLLVKQALIRIAEPGFRSDPVNLPHVIRGILLFGTPNDGLDIESLIPMVNDQPNRSLLESLSPMNSQVLKRQRREFSMLLQRTKFQLFCFYETELSPTAAQDLITGRYKMCGPPRCLVSEPSATSCLPAGASSTHAIALRRTHSDLVKFPSHDTEYDRVANILKWLEQMHTSPRVQESGHQSSQVIWNLRSGLPANGQPTRLATEEEASKPAKRPADEILPSPKRPRKASYVSENRHAQIGGDPALHDPSLHHGVEQLKQSLVDQLYFSQIDERLTHLTPAQGTTCRWFLTEPQYRSWQDVAQQPDHGGFLWIKGNPGTGKSTLMKYLFEMAKLNARTDPSRITLSFFFLARGTLEEKTTMGLYRSLLHQLFEKASDFQDSLRWMTADGARTIQRNGWSEEALQQTLKHAVPKLGSRSLTIYVDALDECDENKAADMVSFFEELCDCAAEANVRVQICFSSRYYPIVVVEKGIEVSLEDKIGHTDDIQKYIKAKLRLKSKQAELLRSEIVEKSSGIFLWVVLVLEILNAQHPAPIKKLRERLSDIPAKLNDLFQMILTRDGHNPRQLQLCLKWILFAARPLKPQELYFAIQLGSDKECSGLWDQDDLDLDDMKTFVRNFSKGLAEVTRNKASEVQFIHESIRDFLLGRYEGQWSGDSDNFKGHGHEVLRDCCLAQLNASINQNVGLPDHLPQASKAAQMRDAICSKFPFLGYTVYNVLYHSDAAQANGIDQTHFVANFPLQRWRHFNNALERHDVRRYTISVTLLYILAEKNLAELIRIHPQRKSGFRVEEERYGAPILAALSTKSREAVWACMKAQAENEPLAFALHGLCEQYARARNKPTNFGRRFTFTRQRDVLTHLLDLDEIIVAVACLLTSHGFDLNSKDSFGQTLLVRAAAEGHHDIVTLMLESGADIEAKSTDSWTSLFAAAQNEQDSITRLLLDRGADVNSKTVSDETPLFAAALNEQESIVKLLLDKGADVNSKTVFNETPLFIAAKNAQDSITRLLLEKGADVSSRNRNGETPLFRAAVLGHESTVRLLLEKGADVSSRNRNGETPLLIAAVLGHESIVRLLLDKGANINANSQTGQTPLLCAAQLGHEAVVSLLLGHGAPIEWRDKGGRTVLSWAITRSTINTKAVVILLLEKGANIESKDNDSWTPLWWAVDFTGSSPISRDVISLLLERGADIESEDETGRTLLSWAAAVKDSTATISLLLEKGASIESKDNLGRTPLWWATNSGKEDNIRVLQSRQ